MVIVFIALASAAKRRPIWKLLSMANAVNVVRLGRLERHN